MDPPQWDDDDNQDDDGEVEEQMSAGRDALIFLIDVTMQMFVANESGDSPFKLCIECCKTTMMNKIISSERDMIGVILFGTSKTNNSMNFQHISVLQDVQQPSAEMIKKLENMLNRKNFDDFENKFGHSDDFALSDALWLCQSTFSGSQLKLSSQRILLFTNTDDPHANNQNKQHQARRKASDLGQVGINIELLHMGTNFDTSRFYKDLIQMTEGEDTVDFRIPNPSTRFEELNARVCRKDHKKRTVAKIPFSLGDGVKFGVAVYNLVRSTPMPKKVNLDRTTNEVVKSSIKTFDADTGEVMLPSDLNKYQEFGFKKIAFRPDEARSLRKIVEPGLQLLGFKPESKIKLHHHIKPSAFIYPEERYIEGSRKLFAALMNRCIERRVVPICCFTPRTNATPSLVALVPQEEKLDDSNIQVLPPGFHVVYLPYSDDIRQLKFDNIVKADPEQIDKAKQLVRKLRFTYSPYSFDNPKLQTHWRNIEALALDYNEPREVTDHTVPDNEYIANKLGSLAREYLDFVYIGGYVPGGKQKGSAGRKRTLDAEREKPQKVAKTLDFDMKELATQGKVEKLKVNELKAFLENEGERVAGMKKVELITKVYQVLGIQQPE